MRDLELETPRHHTFDADVMEGLAADWPRWPVDATPRPFDREAAVRLAERIGRKFWAHLDELAQVFPERDGAASREEAAFWMGLLSQSAFTDSKVANRSWILEKSATLSADPTQEEVFFLLRTAGIFNLSASMTSHLMRALRVLVPWARACEELLDMINPTTACHMLARMGYCPEDQREEVLELVRRALEGVDVRPRELELAELAVYSCLPSPEHIARAVERAPEQRSYQDHYCFLLCLHAEPDRVDAFLRERVFIWEPRHVRLYMARRGMGDLDAFLDEVMTLHLSYPVRPTVETLAMFAHIKAPEVVVRLQPLMERGGELGEVAQRVMDASVTEHAAHGLLACCKRAGKRRTWAVGQLRRLLEREDGRETIEEALAINKGKMVAFVRAEVLDHVDEVARTSLEDAPGWAKALVGAAEGLEEPIWLDAGALPAAVDRQTGAALPAECVEALVRLDAIDPAHEEVVAAALARLTGASRVAISEGLMDQWFRAKSLSRDGSWGRGLELARPLEWLGWHPSPAGAAMLEDYARTSHPPNRRMDADRMTDRAVALLGEMGTPEALSATLRIEHKGRRKGMRALATDALSATQDRLGITREELVDLAAPAFGLDARGGRDFDYGARTIRMKVEAGELLFEDLEGARTYKNAPKGLKSDDVDRVVAARAVFEVTVKPIRAELTRQRVRLEEAMMRRRRWRASWWRERVLGHPLLGPMARESIWEVWRGEDLVTRMRPSEDGGLIDVDFDDVTLEDADVLTLAHPLDLGDDVRAWTEHMLAFELTQPFDQLARQAFGGEEAARAFDEAIATRARVDQKALKRLDRLGPIQSKPKTRWTRHEVVVPMAPKGSLSLWCVPAAGAPGALELDEVSSLYIKFDAAMLDPVTLSECVRVLELAAFEG